VSVNTKNFIELQLFALKDIEESDKTTYLINVYFIAERLLLKEYFIEICKKRNIDIHGVLAILRKSKIDKLLE
jgi:hypothetical protein